MLLSHEIKQQCDAVILAGGQASRMQGCNKLLQCFDGQQRQLEKLVTVIQPQVQQLWINSHRDHEIYQAYDPNIAIFTDIESGFFGPMMGMHSAWQYSRQDWILFVPCDLYQVPTKLLDTMVDTLQQQHSPLCYAVFGQQALYPLCLMHRSVDSLLQQRIKQQDYSLYRCFAELKVCTAYFALAEQQPHSINHWSELDHH